MPSLKSLRTRIASVKATQKITKAMQMVAVAKLRRAQQIAEASRPYADRMSHVLANLARAFEGQVDAPKLLAGTGRDAVHLLVVCTSDRGLCGGFNSSISRLARDHAYRLLEQGKEVKFLCVGRKGHDALKRTFGDLIVEVVELRTVRQIGFEHADAIGKKVLDLFETGGFDVATLFYAHFKSVINQIPTQHRLIPADVPATHATVADSAIYECEPGETEILEDLLPRNISVQIYRALLENVASFFGSQMSAMDSATRNAGDMIKKLTTTYNRSRQAQITKELIEIISGAEAL
ncbi:MAG: F0F1 ATP synthase subunit gamma [Ancalomicrobiaceae bacterium]|nr:F0F1 ATP synthase subunit gamma [Ancalomicrobiaceae bacterium]